MRRLMRATGSVLQAALIVALGAIIVLLALPRVSPFDVLIVRGGSMEPAIHLGSAVVVDRSDRIPVAEAIVMFEDPDSGVVTHRVTRVADGFFETKGDANATADVTRRPFSAMIGTIRFSVPYLGYLLVVLKQPAVFLILLLIAGAMLMATPVRTIADELRTIRRRRASPAAAAGEEANPDAG
jgi:signal peptidase I